MFIYKTQLPDDRIVNIDLVTSIDITGNDTTITFYFEKGHNVTWSYDNKDERAKAINHILHLMQTREVNEYTEPIAYLTRL